MSSQGNRGVHGDHGRSRRIVVELVALVAAGLLLGFLLTSTVIRSPWPSHGSVILASLLAGLVIPVGAAISVLRRTPVFLTLADRVTLARGVLAGGCATLAVFTWAGLLPSQSWLLVLLAAPAALLDAVDGWVARKTGSANDYGARLDMETDAAFLVILSIPAVLIVGPWVLFIGAMRYLFVAAAWWRPALKGKLHFSQFRRAVAALQSIVLVAILVPIVPAMVASALAGTALALLTVSFGKDIYTLEREHKIIALGVSEGTDQKLRYVGRAWQWFCHLLALVVAVEFVQVAIHKLIGDSGALAPFIEFGWPIWLASVTAIGELIGSFLLLVPRSRVIGALLLAGVMVGATITNLANGHPDYVWLNILLLAATFLLVWQGTGESACDSYRKRSIITKTKAEY